MAHILGILIGLLYGTGACVLLLGVVWAVGWGIRRLTGGTKRASGPKVVVWLQHGAERGWLKAFKPDGTPELTTDAFERKVAHASEVEDGTYLLWRQGWVVSILRGWSFQARFEEQRARDAKIARAAEACSAFCDAMKED